MDEDVKPKLTAAWRAAVARLIEAGDVYATMIKVGLSFAKDQVNDNPEPSVKSDQELSGRECRFASVNLERRSSAFGTPRSGKQGWCL
jgi:hypothetical protein